MRWWAGREFEPPAVETADLQPARAHRLLNLPTVAAAPDRAAASWWIPATEWMCAWSRRRDSNPEPAVYKTAALPIELRRRAQGHTAGRPVAPANDTGRSPDRVKRRLRRVVRRGRLGAPLGGGVRRRRRLRRARRPSGGASRSPRRGRRLALAGSAAAAVGLAALGSPAVVRRRRGRASGSPPLGDGLSGVGARGGARSGRVALGDGLEEQDRAGDGGVQRADRRRASGSGRRGRSGGGPPARGPGPRCRRRSRAARGGRPGGRSAARPPRRRRSARPGCGGRSGRRPGRRPGTSSRCSTAPAEALTADGAERRLAAGREDHAVDAGRLGAAQQRPDVLGILERVEDEDERRLARARSPRARISSSDRAAARPDDERDPLVAVEPGERGQRAALDLDDRDPQARRVEDEPLERLAALGHDEQPDGRPLARRTPPRRGGGRRRAPRRGRAGPGSGGGRRPEAGAGVRRGGAAAGGTAVRSLGRRVRSSRPAGIGRVGPGGRARVRAGRATAGAAAVALGPARSGPAAVAADSGRSPWGRTGRCTGDGGRGPRSARPAGHRRRGPAGRAGRAGSSTAGGPTPTAGDRGERPRPGRGRRGVPCPSALPGRAAAAAGRGRVAADRSARVSPTVAAGPDPAVTGGRGPRCVPAPRRLAAVARLRRPRVPLARSRDGPLLAARSGSEPDPEAAAHGRRLRPVRSQHRRDGFEARPPGLARPGRLARGAAAAAGTRRLRRLRRLRLRRRRRPRAVRASSVAAGGSPSP